MKNEFRENLNRESTPTVDVVWEGLKDMPDLGYTSAELKAARDTLNKLKTLGSPHSEFIADSERTLESQVGYVAKREEEEQFRHERTIGRRRFNRNLVLSLAGIVVAITSGLGVLEYVYHTFYSEEAVSRREQEAIEKEEKERQERPLREEKKRQEALYYEEEHTLGLEPSAVSKEGWEIRHLRMGEKADFKQANFLWSSNILRVPLGSKLEIPTTGQFGNTKGSTDIDIQEYQKLNGVWVPKLVIPEDKYKAQVWILRDQPSDLIDNRYVVFRNLGQKLQFYLTFQRLALSTPISYEVGIYK